MRKLLLAAALALLAVLPAVSWADPTAATWGLMTGSGPQPVQILDRSGAWVTTGVLDSGAHTYSGAAGGSNGQVQSNCGGLLCGLSSPTFPSLTVTGTLTLPDTSTWTSSGLSLATPINFGSAPVFPAPTSSQGSIILTPGTDPSHSTPGAMWNDGTAVMANIGGHPVALGAASGAFAVLAAPNTFTQNNTFQQAVTIGGMLTTNVTGGTHCLIADSAGDVSGITCNSAGNISVEAPFLGGSSGDVAPAPSMVASAFYGLDEFGDSITVGTGVASPVNGYAALLAAHIATNVTAAANINNYGHGGDTVGDMDFKMFTDLARPTEAGNPIVTTLIGMNDAGATQTSARQLAYSQAFLAAHAGAALSGANTVLSGAGSVTQAGTWAADSTFANFAGLRSTTNGSTLTLTGYTPNGVFYVWFGLYPTSAGTFTVTVDGVLQTDTVSAGSTIATQFPFAFSNVGYAELPGLARYPVSAGSHTIVVAVTSATGASNKVSIFGFGFPPAQRARGLTAPKVFAGGLIREDSDTNSANTAIVNGLSQTNAGILATDGLNVTFVDVRRYVNDTIDMGAGSVQGCTVSTNSPLHPGSCGHIRLDQGFEDAINSPSTLYGNSHFQSVLDLSNVGAPATLAAASGGGSADDGSTVIPRGSWCVTIAFGYCWGITMTSSGSGFDTVLTTDNLGNGRIAFAAVAGTSTTAGNIASGEFAFFKQDGSFGIGTAVSGDASGNIAVHGITVNGGIGIDATCNTTGAVTLAFKGGVLYAKTGC